MQFLRNPSKQQTLHGKIIYRAKLCDFKEVLLWQISPLFLFFVSVSFGEITFDGPQRICKCDPVTRLLNAKGVNLGMHHVMLEIGPSRLMVGDLWTLLPPHVAVQHSSETNSIKDFVGGWLVDKVVCS